MLTNKRKKRKSRWGQSLKSAAPIGLFNDELNTPIRKLVVLIVPGETILEQIVPGTRTRVRIWLARIMHDGGELRDGCGKKRAIHVANRCRNELHRGSAERHSRHDRRYTASV